MSGVRCDRWQYSIAGRVPKPNADVTTGATTAGYLSPTPGCAAFRAGPSRVDYLRRPGPRSCRRPATDGNDWMTRRMTAASASVSPAARVALLALCLGVAAAAPTAHAAGAGAGAPEANDRLAAQTLAIFGEKCFGCH